MSVENYLAKLNELFDINFQKGLGGEEWHRIIINEVNEYLSANAPNGRRTFKRSNLKFAIERVDLAVAKIFSEPAKKAMVSQLLPSVDEVGRIELAYRGGAGLARLDRLLADTRARFLVYLSKKFLPTIAKDLRKSAKTALRYAFSTGRSVASVREILLQKFAQHRVVRYSKQMAKDAVKQCHGAVQQKILEAYGMEYLHWLGGLRTTSRGLCKHVVNVLGGVIKARDAAPLSVVVAGLVKRYPEGLVAGTSAKNIAMVAGGYGCNHVVVASNLPEL